jgi:hypothetical protein
MSGISPARFLKNKVPDDVARLDCVAHYVLLSLADQASFLLLLLKPHLLQPHLLEPLLLGFLPLLFKPHLLEPHLLKPLPFLLFTPFLLESPLLKKVSSPLHFARFNFQQPSYLSAAHFNEPL